MRTRPTRSQLVSLFLSCLASVLGVVFYAVSFAGGALYPHGAAYVLLWAVPCAAFAVITLLLKTDGTLTLVLQEKTDSSPSLRVIGSFAALAALLFGGYLIGCALRAPDGASVRTVLPAFLSGILAIGGAAFLPFSPLTASSRMTRDGFTGISLLLSFLFYPLYLYFDTSLPKNAPVKLLLLVAYLLAMLCVLSETRAALGKGYPRMTHAVALGVAPFCAAVSAGSLLAAAISGEEPAFGFPPVLMLLFFFLYIYIKELLRFGIIPSLQDPLEFAPVPQEIAAVPGEGSEADESTPISPSRDNGSEDSGRE